MIKPTDFGICVTDYFSKHLAGVRNLSSNTIMSYRDTFCLLLLFLKDEMKQKVEKINLSNIDDKVIYEFLDWLEAKRGNGISTRNQRLAAIHAFYRYIQMHHPEMLIVCQRILAIPLKETIKKAIDYLPKNVLKELLARPNQSDKFGIRDTAILCLLYDSGARVKELIDLTLSDIRLDALSTVRFLGKGRKVRIVPIMNPTAKILKKYLDVWSLDPKVKPNAPLFVNRQGNPFTRNGIRYILQKYMNQVTSHAGQKPVTPHIIRHSKAMHLLQADVNLNYIRDFLGHVNTETTEVYARADAKMKRKALEKVNFDIPLKEQTTWQKNESLMAWLQSL